MLKVLCSLYTAGCLYKPLLSGLPEAMEHCKHSVVVFPATAEVKIQEIKVRIKGHVFLLNLKKNRFN